MGFEWHTSDDDSPPPGWREEKRRGPVHTPRWRWYLLALVATVAAGFYLWRLAEQRIEASVSQLEEDVRLSQSLVERAAATDDPELLRTVLSGREDNWADTQRALVEEGRGYTAIARLLALEPEGAPEELSLTLDPGLRSAELELLQRYTPGGLSVTAEPALLKQTFVFRRGSNRWLLAPPETEFWGPRRSVRTSVAEFRFPQRDGAVVRQLAKDLAADVGAMCALLVAGCPEDQLLTVTFGTDIESVFRFDDGRNMLQSGPEVNLPAPSLIGIPQNDAGYNALRSTYARYLLSALVPVVTKWECCDQVLFWQALQQERLNQLGLAPPLLPPSDSIDALEAVTDVNQFFVTLSQKWQIKAPAPVSTALPLEIRTLVAFFLTAPPTVAGAQPASVAELEAALIDFSSFGHWWSFFTPMGPGEQEAMGPPLLAFAQERYEPPPRPPGLALPDADLLAVCGVQGEEVWRYDLREDSWTQELDLGTETAFAMVVASEDTYYVSAISFVDGDDDVPRFRLFRKQPGEPVEQIGEGGNTVWIPLAKHRDLVPVALIGLESADEPRVGMLDLRECGAGGCTWEETPGVVEASPAGNYELASSMALLGTDTISLRGRGEQWREVAQGASPVWLNDTTFAYLRGRPDAQFEPQFERIMVQDLDGQSAVLVDARTAMAAIGGDDAVVFTSLTVSKNVPDTLFLVATARNKSYLLEIPRPSSWRVVSPIIPVVRAEIDAAAGFDLVPQVDTERWLLVPLTVWGQQPRQAYWLLDLAGQAAPEVVRGAAERFLLPAYDWSPDGAWLAWSALGGIGLMAPGHQIDGEPYQLWLPFGQTDCIMVAWVG
ncbi:MAG: hypothetical protein RRC07_12765 [Anaerolineae bacterium]|nr:hypothetical protein [Anaerolineae bacterium]